MIGSESGLLKQRIRHVPFALFYHLVTCNCSQFSWNNNRHKMLFSSNKMHRNWLHSCSIKADPASSETTG